MIAIILKDSSKTWYGPLIGQAIEVRHHMTNDKYMVHLVKDKVSKFPTKKYLIKTDLELLPL